MQALNVTSRHQEFSSLARKMPGCSPLTAWPPHLLTLLIWSPADTLQISSTPTEPVKWINPSPGATALTTMRMETTVCGMKLISRYGFESAFPHLHKPCFFLHPFLLLSRMHSRFVRLNGVYAKRTSGCYDIGISRKHIISRPLNIIKQALPSLQVSNQ